MYKQLWETNSYRVAARRKENPLDREPRELLVLFVRTSQGASRAGGIGGGRAACACGRWSDAVSVRPCTALLDVALLHYHHFFVGGETLFCVLVPSSCAIRDYWYQRQIRQCASMK